MSIHPTIPTLVYAPTAPVSPDPRLQSSIQIVNMQSGGHAPFHGDGSLRLCLSVQDAAEEDAAHSQAQRPVTTLRMKLLSPVVLNSRNLVLRRRDHEVEIPTSWKAISSGTISRFGEFHNNGPGSRFFVIFEKSTKIKQQLPRPLKSISSQPIHLIFGRFYKEDETLNLLRSGRIGHFENSSCRGTWVCISLTRPLFTSCHHERRLVNEIRL